MVGLILVNKSRTALLGAQLNQRTSEQMRGFAVGVDVSEFVSDPCEAQGVRGLLPKRAVGYWPEGGPASRCSLAAERRPLLAHGIEGVAGVRGLPGGECRG